MLLCWTSTNAAIAVANTPTPINVARATAAAASAFDRAASSATPARTKMSCVPVPDRDVDDHAGRRLRARNAALVGKPRPGDVAADAGDRQQRVDQFADPADPQQAEEAGTAGRRQQLPP